MMSASGWQRFYNGFLTAALISSAAYEDIGPFDEGFPLYYEDSEWCYRARLFGYSIPAAAGAVGFHAMGSSRPSASKQSLSSKKLEQVVYGRLRFALKLLNPAYLIYFLCFYLAEDCTRMLANVFAGRWDHARGIFSAWLGFLRRIDSIVIERKRIQSRRVITDKELFQLHKLIPPVLIRDGRPQLTMDIIRNEYLPKMASGKTTQLPEFDFFSKYPPQFPGSPGFKGAVYRSRSIVSDEGFSALVHRFGRLLQCRLMRM